MTIPEGMGLTNEEWELVRTTATDFKPHRWGFRDANTGEHHL